MTNCNVTVKPGGSLHIQNALTLNGSSLIQVDGATSSVPAGGYICIDPDAVITLNDIASALDLMPSIIQMMPGYQPGINPVLNMTCNCHASPSTFTTYGEGGIHANFDVDVYIQNLTLTGKQYITGQNIYMGSNVQPTAPQGSGSVIIPSGSKIIFHALKNVSKYGGFEVQLGGSSEIK
jgi:hypothetical protein